MTDNGEREPGPAQVERARGHDTRVLILALLSQSDECLTAGQILTRLPGPRRERRSIDYHLRVLLAADLLKQCGEPPTFEAI
jgi:repressor of nif and glnA expression